MTGKAFRPTVPWAARFCLVAALVLLFGIACSAKNPTGGASAMGEQHNVLPPDSFRPLSRTAQIPESVKREFEKSTGDRFNMAEPDGKFDSGCVRTPGSPSMRLRFGGLSQAHCFLFYESGGFAHSFNVSLFSMGSDKASLVWKTYLNPAAAMRATTVDSLRKALDNKSVQ